MLFLKVAANTDICEHVPLISILERYANIKAKSPTFTSGGFFVTINLHYETKRKL